MKPRYLTKLSQPLSILRAVWNHPSNKNHRIKALLKAINWQIRKRTWYSKNEIIFHGLILQCPPNNHSASRAVYFSDYPDYWEMKFIQHYLRPGDHFVDVGANIGLYTLLALSCVGTTGQTHSFEPDPNIAEILKGTLSRNNIDNGSVHQVAVGESPGETVLTNEGDDCTNHIDPNIVSKNQTNIDIVCLQDYLPEYKYVMLKLDIEGYEPFAIRGIHKWMQKGTPPVLQIEIAGYSERYGIKSDAFIRELQALGYFIAVYSPTTGTLEKTNRPWDIPVDNVLAIHAESESFVMDRINQHFNQEVRDD